MFVYLDICASRHRTAKDFFSGFEEKALGFEDLFLSLTTVPFSTGAAGCLPAESLECFPATQTALTPCMAFSLHEHSRRHLYSGLIVVHLTFIIQPWLELLHLFVSVSSSEKKDPRDLKPTFRLEVLTHRSRENCEAVLFIEL